MKKMLVIIPARGGSKGIPRKVVRLMAGRPLLYYSVMACLAAKSVKKVVVSTDHPLIEEVARSYGVDVIRRPAYLALDHVTLDPVIHHAVSELEKKGEVFDLVATVQPTSALITPETIDRAFSEIQKGHDTVISVAPEAHHFWVKENGRLRPFYKKRLNRQYLEPVYRETGAIVITNRKFIKPDSRFGPKLSIFVVPQQEAVDIDDYSDWHLTEKRLTKLKIAIRTIGSKQVGLGHVSRMVNLGDNLFGEEIRYFVPASEKMAAKFIKDHYYSVDRFSDESDFHKQIAKFSPDLLINDMLDTKKDGVARFQAMGIFVVNFEDLGSGSDRADLVINSIYEPGITKPRHLSGYRYEILRDEFLILPYEKKVTKDVKNILLTFGGTDPNNLTKRALEALVTLDSKDIQINIILGLGYHHSKQIEKAADLLNRRGFAVRVIGATSTMSKYMYEADIVLTSNGRTIYEVTAIGTPCISISQNKRETMHLFSTKNPGIVNLGMASRVTTGRIAETLRTLIADYPRRKRMNRALLAHHLRINTRGVIDMIFAKYREAKR